MVRCTWAYFLSLLVTAAFLMNYLGSLGFSFLINRIEKNILASLEWKGNCEAWRYAHMFNAGSSHGLRVIILFFYYFLFSETMFLCAALELAL